MVNAHCKWCYILEARWQMLLLLLYVADGNTTWLVAIYIGRCYCHGGRWNNHPGLVYMFGRCYSQKWEMELPLVSFNLILVLRCLTEHHSKYETDGICHYFYLGMEYWLLCIEPLWSRTSLCLKRIKIQSSKQVESYININVTGWNVMKNTLDSQQEILQRGLRNIWRPLLQYMTTITFLVILLLLIISVYWGERAKSSWGPSKRLYT